MYPIVYCIKNSMDMETQYFIDDGCNVFIYDGTSYNPIHVHNRKKDGRPIVTLDIDGQKRNYLAYRLLMQAATGMSAEEIKRFVVDHVDCDTTHNTFDNFELVSQAENMRRAGQNRLMPYGENHFNSKYSDNLIRGICQDICNNLSRQEIIDKRSVNGQLVDDIKSGRSHRKISEEYIDMGFSYKTYDRSEGVIKATEVCKLAEAGYNIPQISNITGYGRNFVEPVYNRRTFKDVSQNYKF